MAQKYICAGDNGKLAYGVLKKAEPAEGGFSVTLLDGAYITLEGPKISISGINELALNATLVGHCDCNLAPFEYSETVFPVTRVLACSIAATARIESAINETVLSLAEYRLGMEIPGEAKAAILGKIRDCEKNADDAD